jgi:hypothetical protein
MEQMGISDGIPAVSRNRKLSEFRSVEQKYKQLSEFRSEPFRGRENDSEFRSVELKKKQTLGMPSRGRENNSEQNTAAENFINVSYIYLRYLLLSRIRVCHRSKQINRSLIQSHILKLSALI